MGKSSTTNVGRFEHRPLQPTHADRPMATSDSLHAPELAHSGESSATTQTQASQSLSRLESSHSPHEGIARFTGEGTSHAGDMGALGGAQAPADASIHRQSETGAVNPWLMRPSELVRTLNASGFGPVLSERQLRRHLERAGDTISSGSKVDLRAYAAWLTANGYRAKIKPSFAGPVNPQTLLHLLERQKYRCALTDRELTPDIAALDHIVPVSRDGKHEPGNIQILDKQVNRAKGTLTNDEFIQLCRDVVAHATAIHTTPQEI